MTRILLKYLNPTKKEDDLHFNYVYDLQEGFPLTTIMDINIHRFKSNGKWDFNSDDYKIDSDKLIITKLGYDGFHFMEYCQFIAIVAFEILIQKEKDISPYKDIRYIDIRCDICGGVVDKKLLQRILKTKSFGEVPEVSVREKDGIYTLDVQNYEIKNPGLKLP